MDRLGPEPAVDLKVRTRAFALRIVRLVGRLPRSLTADVIGRQLLRCGTSVGANYRAACRARTKPEFISKLGIVEEEADETVYWLEILAEGEIVRAELLSDLIAEANEILAMTIASINTAKRSLYPPKDRVARSEPPQAPR